MPTLQAASLRQMHRLKPFLDEWVAKVETPEYIANDPVSFMHAFDDTEDQAIAGFYAATMAWGRRDIVLAKVDDLLQRMDYQPAAFVRTFRDDARPVFDGFKHRTFKPVDMFWITKVLQHILSTHGSFEAFWAACYRRAQAEDRELTAVFHEAFFARFPHMPQRTRKHVSNTEKGSAAKRLYMYLRWTIRRNSPVDPGIMEFMPPHELMLPLDVHAARQARTLGLLTRTYSDWKATCELTRNLLALDSTDPVKYDYALFGIGVRDAKIPDEFVVNP